MIIFNREFGDHNIRGWLVADQGPLKDEILLEPENIANIVNIANMQMLGSLKDEILFESGEGDCGIISVMIVA